MTRPKPEGGPPPGKRPGPGPARRPGPPPAPRRPRCELEVVDPDDVLVMSINERWFRTFTSGSDRYPLKMDIPQEFLHDRWNLVHGSYTNVALTGRNDATVEYRILLDGNEVVHVVYRTEVEPQTFTIEFKDTFSLHARERKTGHQISKGSTRFDQLMEWQDEGDPES